MPASNTLLRHATLLIVAIIGGVFAVAASPAGLPLRPVQPVSAPVRTIRVPYLVGSAFVFAKGELTEAGLTWSVRGRVQGYAANPVVRQQPAGGTLVVDTGAPVVKVWLQRSPTTQLGIPDDRPPLMRTPLRIATSR